MTSGGNAGGDARRSHEHWQDVYARKSADEVSWFQAHPHLSLRLIKASGVGPDEPIIDVGGGASVLVDRLLEKGYSDISVLDIAESALARSQERLGERANQIGWIVANVLSFRPRRPYALWHDRALLHFMVTPDQRAAYAATLDRALRSGGQAIISAFAMDGPRRCSGLEIVRYNAERLCSVLGEQFQLLQAIDEYHPTPMGTRQKFTWFRLRKL